MAALPIAVAATTAAVAAYGARVASQGPPETAAQFAAKDETIAAKDAIIAKLNKEKLEKDAMISKMKYELEEIKKRKDALEVRAIANSVPEEAFRKANPEVLTRAAKGVVEDLGLTDGRAKDLIMATAGKLINRGTIWQLFQRVTQLEGDAPVMAESLPGATAPMLPAIESPAGGGRIRDTGYDAFADVWLKRIEEATVGVTGLKEQKKTTAAKAKEDSAAVRAADVLKVTLEKALTNAARDRIAIDDSSSALPDPIPESVTTAREKLDLLLERAKTLVGALPSVKTSEDYDKTLRGEQIGGGFFGSTSEGPKDPQAGAKELKEDIAVALKEYKSAVQAAKTSAPKIPLSERLFGKKTIFNRTIGESKPTGGPIHTNILAETPKTIEELKTSRKELQTIWDTAKSERDGLCRDGGTLLDYKGGPEAYEKVTELMRQGETVLKDISRAIDDFETFQKDYAEATRGIAFVGDESFELTASEKAEAEKPLTEEEIAALPQEQRDAIRMTSRTEEEEADRQMRIQGRLAQLKGNLGTQMGGAFTDLVELRNRYISLQNTKPVVGDSTPRLEKSIQKLREIRAAGQMTPEQKVEEEGERAIRAEFRTTPLPTECLPYGVVAPISQVPETPPAPTSSISSPPPAPTSSISSPPPAPPGLPPAPVLTPTKIFSPISGTTIGNPQGKELASQFAQYKAPVVNSRATTVRRRKVNLEGGARKRTLRTHRGVNKRKNVRGSRSR